MSSIESSEITVLGIPSNKCVCVCVCVFSFTLRFTLRDVRMDPKLKGLYWEPQIGNPKNIVGI